MNFVPLASPVPLNKSRSSDLQVDVVDAEVLGVLGLPTQRWSDFFLFKIFLKKNLVSYLVYEQRNIKKRERVFYDDCFFFSAASFFNLSSLSHI